MSLCICTAYPTKHQNPVVAVIELLNQWIDTVNTTMENCPCTSKIKAMWIWIGIVISKNKKLWVVTLFHE